MPILRCRTSADVRQVRFRNRLRWLIESHEHERDPTSLVRTKRHQLVYVLSSREEMLPIRRIWLGAGRISRAKNLSLPTRKVPCIRHQTQHRIVDANLADTDPPRDRCNLALQATPRA